MRRRPTRMKRPIRIFLLLFLSFLCFAPLNAQEEQRGFDKSQLQAYQADSDFQYEVVKAKPENAIERWWRKMRESIMSLFQSESSRNIADVLVKILVFFAVVYFIIKIFGIEATSVFKPSLRNELDFFDVKKESLDRINFEAEIETALLQKEYRVAIRLMYLNALFKASKAGLIDLRQGKTNREYAFELAGNAAEGEFNELAYLFDYTWYGHFEADEKLSRQAKQFLNGIDQKWANER